MAKGDISRSKKKIDQSNKLRVYRIFKIKYELYEDYLDGIANIKQKQFYNFTNLRISNYSLEIEIGDIKDL